MLKLLIVLLALGFILFLWSVLFMNWIATLSKSDLKAMKQALEKANKNNYETLEFQEVTYNIGYIKNVVDYLEGVVFLDDLNN